MNTALAALVTNDSATVHVQQDGDGRSVLAIGPQPHPMFIEVFCRTPLGDNQQRVEQSDVWGVAHKVVVAITEHLNLRYCRRALGSIVMRCPRCSDSDVPMRWASVTTWRVVMNRPGATEKAVPKKIPPSDWSKPHFVATHEVWDQGYEKKELRFFGPAERRAKRHDRGMRNRRQP